MAIEFLVCALIGLAIGLVGKDYLEDWKLSKKAWAGIQYNIIPRRYAKLYFDGSWCVMSIQDAEMEVASGYYDDGYTMEIVWMTPRKLDSLPEFQGF